MARNEYKDWTGFGSRVKDNRKKLGLTREKLSEMIDRTENYLISLEKGDKSCSVHTVHQLSKALKVQADDSLYGKKVEEKDYSNKEILKTIIDRCDEAELKIIKEVIVAIYPNFRDIINWKYKYCIFLNLLSI